MSKEYHQGWNDALHFATLTATRADLSQQLISFEPGAPFENAAYAKLLRSRMHEIDEHLTIIRRRLEKEE